MGLKEKIRERWDTRGERRQKRQEEDYAKLVEEEKKLDNELKLITKKGQVKEKRRQANPITRRLFAKKKPQTRAPSTAPKKKKSRKKQTERTPERKEYQLPDLTGGSGKKKKKKEYKLPKL